jgi:hypothetical protein
MEWAAAQLGINNLSGWYKVKYTTLKKLGGSFVTFLPRCFKA